jgi:UDP-glucuronate 4-epimerase
MLKDHKVLVTGLTGNLGGSVAKMLSENNDIWGYARFSREGQLDYWRENGVNCVVGDWKNGAFDGLPNDFDYVINSGANTQPVTIEDGMRDNCDGTALFMAHCRNAKAFLHVSSGGIYANSADPNVWITEDGLVGADQTGGSAGLGHYLGSKLASEGAVRAMCVHLGLPTIICRLGVQYGQFSMGGMPGLFLRMILEDQVIPLPSRQHNMHMLISDDDVVRFLEPTLKAATIPATTINCAGDEAVSTVELLEYMGKLAGKTPRYAFSDQVNYPCLKLDPTRRKAMTGPCQVDWRDGVARMYETFRTQSGAAFFSNATVSAG